MVIKFKCGSGCMINTSIKFFLVMIFWKILKSQFAKITQIIKLIENIFTWLSVLITFCMIFKKKVWWLYLNLYKQFKKKLRHDLLRTAKWEKLAENGLNTLIGLSIFC